MKTRAKVGGALPACFGLAMFRPVIVLSSVTPGVQGEGGAGRVRLEA